MHARSKYSLKHSHTHWCIYSFIIFAYYFALLIYRSIILFIHLFIYSLIYSFIQLFIRSLFGVFIYLSFFDRSMENASRVLTQYTIKELNFDLTYYYFYV